MIIRFIKQKGSALLITLLVMGVLMTLALGLSSLVMREIRITSDIVNSGRALYAAESGVESALLDINQKLPGFEKEDKMIDGELLVNNDSFDIEENLSFDYSINNRTKSVPFVDTEVINKEIAINNPKQYLYNVLELNDTITIPLFIQNEDGSVENVTDFRVEYFIDDVIAQEWKYQVQNQYIDMLRWKITGINSGTELGNVCSKYYDPNPDKLTTESIGDYLPVLDVSHSEYPSCFGTKKGSVTDDKSGITYNENCAFLWKWAREAFVFQVDENGVARTVKYTDDADTFNPVTIKEFLNCHNTNYLSLSNIMNPQFLKGLSDFERRNNAKIYYRILIPNDNEYTTRDFAKIKSTGNFRNLRKQIEAFIKPDTFMPVFNYSLYRTQVGGEGDKQTPKGYLENPSE